VGICHSSTSARQIWAMISDRGWTEKSPHFTTSISANNDGPCDIASYKINHITLTPNIQLPRNERWLIANYYTGRERSVIDDNAQTPLGQFVVDILYNQVCNKYTDKSN